MHRFIPVAAVIGALALAVAAFGSAQAAPVAGLNSVAANHRAQATTMVDQAGWRRWRNHRNWWWRWRRW
jgi:thioesterase domain-containing protein